MNKKQVLIRGGAGFTESLVQQSLRQYWGISYIRIRPSMMLENGLASYAKKLQIAQIEMVKI